MPDGRKNHLPLSVLYTGAVKDLSGYAAAARDYIRSLDAVGVDLAVDARTFELQSRRLQEEVVECKMWEMMGKHPNAPIQIIHLTPDNYSDYSKNGKYRIGYFAWETSRLPPAWVKPINEVCREVWVPCQYLADISTNSGVQIPIRVLPHAVPLPSPDFKPSASIVGIPENSYKFYSIFQWSERKNPINTLLPYYLEFSRSDPVVFILKTYRVGNAKTERDHIRREISRLKKITKGPNCPPVLLIEEFLSAREIQDIHHASDCYVSMARSEGFGIPAFEAAAMGNTVIVPNYSAFPEHFSDDNAYLVDVPTEVPIENMRHISILYTGDMYWGNPSVDSCRTKMRHAFENRDIATQKGLRARSYVSNHLSYEAIGRMMKGWIEPIQKELLGQ